MYIFLANPVERMVISMLDAFGREINYMRISVTDKCNLRCRYCMPEGVEIVPMSSLLTMEEIAAVCRQASYLGIDRIKITGGEPLVRKGVVELVKLLKELTGIRQVTMTTNGVLLSEFLPELLTAGLDAVNISLDTMDAENYRFITGRNQLDKVLCGIREAVFSGVAVKINAVLMRGINDQEWTSLLRLAKDYPLDVRFIELMPIGAGAEFENISNAELLSEIKAYYPGIEADTSVHGNGPAVYYRIPGFLGGVGFISAMHGKFCGSCNRIRMTAMGDLKPCLCYGTAVNIREMLREQGEEAVHAALKEIIRRKPEAHCFENREEITEKNRMIAIGG